MKWACFAFGASSLEQALSFVAQQGSVHSRVLVVSDGVITAGASDTISLREAIAKLAAHGAERLDVLAEGGIQDRDTLRALTSSGLREAGTVLDGRMPVAQLAERMLLGVQDKIEVHVSGATWVHPEVLTNVHTFLVIGPNRVFLRYIEQVLPSLGEAGIDQVVLSDLVPDVRFERGADDNALTAKVKGDARMSDVIDHAVADRERPLQVRAVGAGNPRRGCGEHRALSRPPETRSDSLDDRARVHRVRRAAVQRRGRLHRVPAPRDRRRASKAP